MEVIARRKLGMSRKEFYSLTWYDWTLWIERIKELDEQRKSDRETLIDIARSSLSRYFNIRYKANIHPEDIFTLPFDRPREDTEPSREEKIKAAYEVAERVKKRLKRG